MSLCLNCMEFTLLKLRYWNIFFIGPYQVSKVLVFFRENELHYAMCFNTLNAFHTLQLGKFSK